MKALFLALVLVGCGAKESLEGQLQSAAKSEQSEKVKEDPPSGSPESLEEAEASKGERGYSGKDGKNGKDGINGKDGERGIQGERGENGNIGSMGQAGADGRDGSNGSNGSNGTNGQNGADGEDGQDAQTMRLIAMNGDYIGDVYSMSTSSVYHVVRGSHRYSIYRASGQLDALYFIYSGANCTGTRQMVMINGQWSNVGEEIPTGLIVKAIGTHSNSVPYVSRSNGGSCQNSAGTAHKVFATQTVTLPFAYPIVEPEIQN